MAKCPRSCGAFEPLSPPASSPGSNTCLPDALARSAGPPARVLLGRRLGVLVFDDAPEEKAVRRHQWDAVIAAATSGDAAELNNDGYMYSLEGKLNRSDRARSEQPHVLPTTHRRVRRPR
mmetsp:Transcript_37667/g.73787  ORF Transcript_37667/g.73787 Transcript_37667/m.73787 type:complete len:120 (-) Transcript_37667:1494-1853(-)